MDTCICTKINDPDFKKIYGKNSFSVFFLKQNAFFLNSFFFFLQSVVYFQEVLYLCCVSSLYDDLV